MNTLKESRTSGLGFAGLYADEGLSGTSYKRRTQFNQMIEDAKLD